MILVVLKKTPKRLHGIICRLLTRITTNTYIGSYSVRVRASLNDLFEGVLQGTIIMAWDSTNEAGFEVKAYGEAPPGVLNLDGLNLFAMVPRRTVCNIKK